MFETISKVREFNLTTVKPSFCSYLQKLTVNCYNLIIPADIGSHSIDTQVPVCAASLLVLQAGCCCCLTRFPAAVSLKHLLRSAQVINRGNKQLRLNNLLEREGKQADGSTYFLSFCHVHAIGKARAHEQRQTL